MSFSQVLCQVAFDDKIHIDVASKMNKNPDKK